LVGVDIFVHWNGLDPDEVAENLKKIGKKWNRAYHDHK